MRATDTRVPNVLFGRIIATECQPIDMAKRFRFYSFDVMNNSAFGKLFNMLNTSRNHWAIDLLDATILPLALQLPVCLLRSRLSIPHMIRALVEI